ncbi:MAG: extracellular solute-binding protein [Planctomycetota bacterium]|jgi:molybdate/tungstate transport system substrate-binding protein
MRKITWQLIVSIIVLLVLSGGLVGCKKKHGGSARNELIIFHAGSLSVPFRELSALFEKEHPDIAVKAEASGSRSAARKICDLERECDVIASADYKVVANLLMPDYADFNIRFALNEMVIAYTNESKLSISITPQNWPKILLNEEVAFGRSDHNLDPCGYRTLMVFQLAEKHYGLPGLAETLHNKTKYIRPKETDLLALLEAGEIDSLFIYRSVAAQHGLNMILLPDEINLKSPTFAQLYNTATVKLSGKIPGQFITCQGEPMVYSVTIPQNAPNPEAAEAWIALLLSRRGREIMENNGQPCITPPQADGFDKLPESLRQFSKNNKVSFL